MFEITDSEGNVVIINLMHFVSLAEIRGNTIVKTTSGIHSTQEDIYAVKAKIQRAAVDD